MLFQGSGSLRRLLDRLISTAVSQQQHEQPESSTCTHWRSNSACGASKTFIDTINDRNTVCSMCCI